MAGESPRQGSAARRLEQGSLAVRRRLRWHIVRWVAIASLPAAVAAFAVAEHVDLLVEVWLQAFGVFAALVFVGGFAVLPFYAGALSVVVAGAGPAGEAARLLRREAQAERAVVATRWHARWVAFVVVGLGLLSFVVWRALERGVEEGLSLVVPGLLFGAAIAIELIQAVNFFVFAKRLSLRQCALAEAFLAKLCDRLGERVEVTLRCELKGYEASARPYFATMRRTVSDEWDHDWLACTWPLQGGASAELRVVQHASAERRWSEVSSADTWAASLHEEATVDLRLGPVLGGSAFRREEAPVELAGMDVSFELIDGQILRARAVTCRPVSVTTTDGEVTKGDESGLFDDETVWRLVEACCAGLSITDYRRERGLELMPCREEEAGA